MSVKPLTVTEVKGMKPREKDYAVYDGFGLLLNVSKAGGKVWRFRYSHPITKKRQTYTIGRFPEFSLAEAREVRDELRRMIARGVDPVTEKKNRKIEMSLKNLQTFEAIANAWFAFKKGSELRKPTLYNIEYEVYKYLVPFFGKYSIEKITAPVAINALDAVSDKNALQKKLISRLNEIMNYAVNCGALKTNPLLKIKTALMESIPEDITQLYPEARNIKRHFILHIGETNTGKTHDALEDFYNADAGMYLAPLRLLALEIQEMSLARGINCSLTTGEEKDIRDGAKHLSCTVEKMDMSRHFDVCVIDEAQMVADSDRGWAWTEAILGVNADVVHVCMSPNAIHIVKMLIKMCGDTYTDIRHKRNSRLIVEDHDFIFPDDIRDGDALVAFSRRKVLMLATLLKKEGYKVSVIYGSLPYSVRKAEVARFLNGESRIVVCTDAIGMGVNLPIRRIIFTESKKFDGKSKRLLNMSEVKQIAGRAGRKGMYDQGYVNSIEDRDQIGELLHGRYEQITSCVIQPPRKVLDMPYSLSEIFKIWLKTIEKKCFSVADLKNRIKLAEYIEKKHGEKINKDLEYSLINIPFDENSEKLKYLWQDLVDMTADGEPVSRMWYYVDTESEDIEAMKLDDLEQLYKKMDLLNSYCNALNISEYDERIRMLKEEISECIVRELTNGEFFNKCKRCGKKLEWNHRFGMCEKCYEINKLERMRYKADKWR